MDTMGKKILCGVCREGEMVAEELVQIGFRIASDGKGGFYWTGDRAYENNSDEDEIVARCRECGHDVPIADLRGLVEQNGKVYA